MLVRVRPLLNPAAPEWQEFKGEWSHLRTVRQVQKQAIPGEILRG